MPRVVITGGPGVGKTTLLRALQARGHAVVEESARALIRERLAQGLPPRPAPPEFAAELIRRDRASLGAVPPGPGWTFFDRGLVESVGMGLESGLLTAGQADALLAEAAFHPQVFVLPPWPAIYVTDAERDHDFAHCQRVDRLLRQWYGRCGYGLCELPCLPPEARADWMLSRLAAPGTPGPRGL